MSRWPALIIALAMVSSGCAFSYGRTTHWRSPDNTQHYRLARIADSPSEPGTREALNLLVRGKHTTAALAAIEAGLPDHMGPLEDALLTLPPEVRADLYTVLARHKDPRVQRLLVRAALELGEGQPEAARLLTGRADPEAVDALTKLSAVEDAAARKEAASALAAAAVDQAPVRTLLISLASGDADAGVSSAAFVSLGRPASTSEVKAGIDGTQKPATAIAALHYLAAARPMPPEARARLVALMSTDDATLRWPATKALAGQRAQESVPGLIQFLDDPAHQEEARSLLVSVEEVALGAIRTDGASVKDSTGRWVLAQALVNIAGPGDEALVRTLGEGQPTADIVAAVDRLKKNSPGALFPKGVQYYEGRVSGEPLAKRTTWEALAIERRAVVAAKADPGARYMALARLVLLGARSPATLAQLEDAAAAAQKDRAFYFVGSLGLNGGYPNQKALAKALSTGLDGVLPKGWPARIGSPPKGIPAGRITTTLECQTHRHGKTTESDYTHTYEAWSPNPERKAIQDQIDALPGAVSACAIACGPNREPCGLDVKAALRDAKKKYPNDACEEIQSNVENPEAQRLTAQLEALPERITKPAEIIGKLADARLFNETTCKGRIRVALNNYTRETTVKLRSAKVTTTLEKRATEDDYYGKASRTYKNTEGPTTVDPRIEELTAGFGRAIARVGGGLSGEVSRTMRSAPARAKADGNVAAARTLTLWNQPDLIAPTVDQLGPFQSVFLSNGNRAFRVR